MVAPLVHPDRPDRVRSLLLTAEVDALVVSDLTNLRWLTGFSGSAGVAVLDAERLVVITDGRYDVQARTQLAASGVTGEVFVGTTQDELLTLLAGAAAHARVGFEAAHTSVSTHQRWQAALTGALVATTGVVEAARRAKSPAEIERIACAAAIADEALADVVDHIRPGITEVALRNLLEIRMRELGAEGPSYETIVAAGPQHAALPHHRPKATEVADGDTVVIDVGALVEGYHSDMTRTFLVGEPSAEQLRWYDLVAASQAAGLAVVRAGVAASAVDAACRSVFAEAGVEAWFVHGTGHGVGLLIHEDPFLNGSATDTLREGDVVTVEPGLYRVGLGGVRIEDLVVVTSDGHRNLTHSPKDQPCLPSPPTT
jgi:Xaa-Pro aminopeptidase